MKQVQFFSWQGQWSNWFRQACEAGSIVRGEKIKKLKITDLSGVEEGQGAMSDEEGGGIWW